MGLTIDRDKVIKGLEGIIDYFFDVYRNGTDSYKCEKAQEYSDIAINAVALLKEQEAVMVWKDARQETPDKQGDYLVFIPGEFHDTMMVARYSFNCENPWRGAQAHSAIEDVLFWIPLPNAPKEGR